MKKTISYCLLLTGIALAGCNKEGIISDDPWNQNSEEGGSTSGVTGATTLPLTQDEEDLIVGTTFSRTISITFSNSGDAQVTGDKNGIVTVKGNQVTVDNTITSEKVRYELSGTTSNGFLKIYSKNKQALVLNNVSITNPNGAAINNQGKKRSFIVVNGQNYLADGGATYSATPDDEDEKAAFFSEGQLIFSGDGTLEVKAVGKAGITSDDYLNFLSGPTIQVSSSAGHGLRGKDAVYVNGGALSVQTSAHMKKGIVSDSLVVFNGGVTTVAVSGGTDYDEEDQEYKASAGVKADQCFVMNDGTLTITNSGQGGKGISGDGVAYFQGGTVDITVTGSNYGKSSQGFGPWGGGSTSSDDSKSAKGIKFDGDIYISGGSVSAKASNHEGIESKGQIQITGGTVFAQSKDDAVNSAGMMAVTGGFVCAYSTGNDGMDANGNMYIEGGVVYAVGSGTPEVALDANTEDRCQLYVNGGTLFTLGGLESGAVTSQKCYQASSWSRNTWYSLTVGNDSYSFKTPSSGGSGLVVSGSTQPTVKSNVSVTGGTQIFNGMGVVDGTVSGGSDVSLSAYSGGNSGPGGWGPGR